MGVKDLAMARPLFFSSAALALCLLWSAPAAAQLKIYVEGADFRPFPVAAPDLILDGTESKEAMRLSRDLSRALQLGIDLMRVFELVPPKSYLASPREPWTAPVYKDWFSVGASGLVRGRVEVKGEKVTVGLRFFDVVAQRELLDKSYDTTPDQARRAVHEFIDELVQLLTGNVGIFSSRLAFVKRTKNGKAIYVSDIDGYNMRRVSDADALSLLPAWDRSGRYVMFTSYLKLNPDLYRLDLQTNDLEWLSKNRGLNTGASISPDGKRIALTLSVDGNTEIYVMDWNGKNLKRLTNSWGQDVSATWSPDGKRIAFVSSRSGQPHIYVMSSDGSNQRRLTFQGAYNQEPNWSPLPSGLIAFTARDENLMYDIFAVHPDTGVITRLTQDEGHKNEHPAFSPDGQQIVFTSNRPPHRGKKLYIMDVDGRNQRRISRVRGDYETPRWGPRMGYR